MINFCYDETENAVEKGAEPGRFGPFSFRKDYEEISAFLTNRSLRREKRMI